MGRSLGYRSLRSARLRARPFRAPLRAPCATRRTTSSRRSRSCRQSTEAIGRYRRPTATPTASAMARAQSTRVRSGSVACVTAVHRGAFCLFAIGAEAKEPLGAHWIWKPPQKSGPADRRPGSRVIEADVLPTSPGHGDACGALL